MGGLQPESLSDSNKSMTVASCAVNLECRGSDELETGWIGLCAFGKQAEALAALPDIEPWLNRIDRYSSCSEFVTDIMGLQGIA